MKIPFLIIGLALASCKLGPPRPNLSNKQGGTIDQRPGKTPVGGKPDKPDQPTTGADPVIGFNTAIPRLSHEEWENSVKDVFLMNEKPGLASRFAADGDSTLFKNDSDINKISSNLTKNYRESSEEVAKRVASDGDLMKKLIPSNAPAGDTKERALAILTPIATRAYRRPLTEPEINGLSALFMKGKEFTGRGSFDAGGVEVLATALLQSPQFLYHPELGEKEGEFAKLAPYEVASRLSYALWKSIPDQALLKSAAEGKLETEEGIEAEIERMMKDPRTTETIRYFVNELFETKKFVGIKKDSKMYPKFPNDLGDTLKREAELFIDDVVIKNNGGMTKLLTASYAFVNDKTAPLYDIALPGTMELTKVELDPKKRAGLITQLGWLSYNASDTRTSAIHRGFYVLSRLACDTLPPMFGGESKNEVEFKTRRDELSFKTGTCGGACHNSFINPPAFALEAYDASGMFRATENGNPINTTGVYGVKGKRDAPTAFNDAVELMQGISSRITTHECVVQRSIELLYNRRVNEADATIVARLGEESRKGLGIKAIFKQLISDTALLGLRSDNK